jgi:Protein of unknown function (DUF3313)
MRYAARLLSSLPVLALLTYCASGSADPGPERFSGYLQYDVYDRLEPARAPSGHEFLRWRDPELGPKYYDTLILEPVTVYPATSVTPELEKITTFLTVELRQRLAATNLLVDTPSPRTVRLNVALTAVDVSKSPQRASAVIPSALGLGDAGGKPMQLDLYFETKIKDSRTGRFLGSSVRKISSVQVQQGPDLASFAPELSLLADDARDALRGLATPQ